MTSRPRPARTASPVARTLTATLVALAAAALLGACTPAAPSLGEAIAHELESVPGVDGVEVTTRAPGEATDTATTTATATATAPATAPAPATATVTDGPRVTFWVDVGGDLDAVVAAAVHKVLLREAGGLDWDVWYQDGPPHGDLPARRSVHADAAGIPAEAFTIAHSPGVVTARIDGPGSTVRTTYADQLVDVAALAAGAGTGLADLGAADDTVARGEDGPPDATVLRMLAALRDVPGFVGSAYDDRGLAATGEGHLTVVATDDAAAGVVAAALDQGGWSAVGHPVAYVVEVGDAPPAIPADAVGTAPSEASAAGARTGWVSRRDPDAPVTGTGDPDVACGALTGRVTGQDAAMGRRWLTIVLTNGGTRACTLDATPTLRFRTLSGAVADVGEGHDQSSLAAGPGKDDGPVDLAPGRSAAVDITWRGGSTALDPDVTAMIEVVVAPGADPVVVPLTDQADVGAPTSLDIVDGVDVTVGTWR